MIRRGEGAEELNNKTKPLLSMLTLVPLSVQNFFVDLAFFTALSLPRAFLHTLLTPSVHVRISCQPRTNPAD